MHRQAAGCEEVWTQGSSFSVWPCPRCLQGCSLPRVLQTPGYGFALQRMHLGCIPAARWRLCQHYERQTTSVRPATAQHDLQQVSQGMLAETWLVLSCMLTAGQGYGVSQRGMQPVALSLSSAAGPADHPNGHPSCGYWGRKYIWSNKWQLHEAMSAWCPLKQ